ncbi:MAG: TonB-dependent receptor [Saprospiraceae bacterium]|nr:TonB-dependent receptor [Saprospiraceae bacterium]
MFKRIIGLFLFISLTVSVSAQQATLFGKVKNTAGEQLSGARIELVNQAINAVTDENGVYTIEVPADTPLLVEISFVGYENQLYTITLQPSQKKRLNVDLVKQATLIEDVVISQEEKTRDQVSATTIDGELLEDLPAVTGGVEALLKALPGVNSSNELSSQYSVRGGNFDENLVYINGFEVYRPQLIRSGQQEGLSIINPDLTGNIYFSSGGFEPLYGDKLSSVLDITYKQPTTSAGGAYLGFLGAGAHLQNQSKNGKFSYLGGARYQTNKYLLNTLDEAGEYNPYSQDGQLLLSYAVSERTTLEALGYYGRTVYDFVPDVQSSNFGNINNILTFSADLDGAEEDEFTTAFGGVSLSTAPNDQTVLKFNLSAHSGTESEDINITSDYLLGFLDPIAGTQVDTLAAGLQTDIVDNYLESTILNLQHTGFRELANGKHFLSWGVGYKAQEFTDRVYELDQLDTTSLTLPGMPVATVFREEVQAANSIDNNIVSGHLQDTWLLDEAGNIVLTAGARMSNSSFTEETLISPRLQFSFRPDWTSDVVFKGAAGLYQQHPLYRDLRRRDGSVNTNIVAQKSFQTIVGTDIKFEWRELPVRFTAEAYYKDLWDVIPYEYDVLRIRYLGENNASAYVAGLDFRFFGEFVEDAESWVSLSFLKTEEDIEGQGVVRRPTDQRVNASMLFQDYFPNNKNFRVKLLGNYGGRFPVGIANGNRLDDTFEVPSYTRFDVGFAANLKGKRAARLPNNPFEKLKSVWLTAEVFNMFDNDNTQSFQWVFTPDQTIYAVPNDLTGRRLNAKLSVRF